MGERPIAWLTSATSRVVACPAVTVTLTAWGAYPSARTRRVQVPVGTPFRTYSPRSFVMTRSAVPSTVMVARTTGLPVESATRPRTVPPWPARATGPANRASARAATMHRVRDMGPPAWGWLTGCLIRRGPAAVKRPPITVPVEAGPRGPFCRRRARAVALPHGRGRGPQPHGARPSADPAQGHTAARPAHHHETGR